MADQKEKYRSRLSNVQGKKDGFVTFKGPNGERFIQFAVIDGSNEFRADIPSSEVNSAQPHPSEIEAEYPEFEARDDRYGTTYETDCSLTEALDYTNRFFSSLCDLTDEFGLEVNEHHGDEDITCFGCEVSAADENLNTVQTDPENLYDLDVEEAKIEQEIETAMEISRDTVPENIDGDQEEAIRNHLEFTFMITLCEECQAIVD